MRETHMKRALTLNEQQYRYAITFCNTRKHTLRDKTIIHMSFLAGLRAIEIAALCVGDVYDERGRARSQFTITQAQTKGDSARTIYVNKKLMRILDAYHVLVAGTAASAPPFMTQMRTRFSANTMCQLFLQIYKDCGLKGATSHSGRRTYITKLANAGINVRLLAELAGHKHISTTQRYIDVNDAQLAHSVELLCWAISVYLHCTSSSNENSGTLYGLSSTCPTHVNSTALGNESQSCVCWNV